MKFSPEHFDDLRTKARDLHASNLTRSLFASIINDMEKITNMIQCACEVDNTKHDENGAVLMSDDCVKVFRGALDKYGC